MIDCDLRGFVMKKQLPDCALNQLENGKKSQNERNMTLTLQPKNYIRVTSIINLNGKINYLISQPTLLKLINSFRKDHTIFAPVKVGKSDYQFAKNPDSSEIVFRYPLTILPPKKVFLPPKELLLKRSKSGQLEEVLSPNTPPPTPPLSLHLPP